MSPDAIAILATSFLLVGLVVGAAGMFWYLSIRCSDPDCKLCRFSREREL